MLLPADAPLICARLLRLAERAPHRALPLARRAAQRAAPGDPLLAAWAGFTLGWALLRAERLDEAQRQLDQATAALRALRRPREVLHGRRALLLLDLMRGAGAPLQDAWAALALEYEALHLPLDAARTRTQQALHLVVLGRARDALRLAEGSAALITARGSSYDRALLLRVRAMAEGHLGRLPEADALLAEAEALFAQLPCPLEVAKCWLERAWNQQRREQFEPAERDIQRALALFQRLDLPLNTAFCEKSLGLVASRLGRYDRALALTLRARSQFVALGRRDQAAACDLNLGNIAYYNGLFELAQAAYLRAEAVNTELGLRQQQLTSRRNQALVLRAQGDPAEALRRLLPLEPGFAALGEQLEVAEVRFAQAQALADLGAHAAALRMVEAAQAAFVALGNPAAAAECRLLAGWIQLAQHSQVAAARCFGEAAAGLPDRPMHLWLVEYGLGRCAQLAGRSEEAAEHYLRAGAIVARLRRTLANEHTSSGLFLQARQLYRDALGLAADRGDALAVLALAEQQRALALERQISSGAAHRTPEQQRSYETQQHALRRLVSESPTPAALDAALGEYVAELLQPRHSLPLPLDEPPEPPDLAALRVQLDAAYGDGWLVLLYAECGADLLTVAIDSSSIALTRTPYDARLRWLLERACLPAYRRLTFLDLPLLRGQTQTPWSTLSELAERLIPAGVRARLHPALRLLVVPCGQLHALPWAALRLPAGFLCEQAVIQLLPALALWPALVRRPVVGQAALLLGCSHFGERAPELPGVAAELDLVAACWPGPCTRMQDAAATRAALLEQAGRDGFSRYRLLHIASHAQLTAARGPLAHIKLWDDDLLLPEVIGLRLRGALVVLAACDGAASELLPGEELLGLSRAFLAAGARDVVASLWAVPDLAVQRVLALFYTGLVQGLDPPTALAWAQRTVLARGEQDSSGLSTPLVWGGLQALGSGTSPQEPAGGALPTVALTA